MLTVYNLRILFILTLLPRSTLCLFLGARSSPGHYRRPLLGARSSAGCSRQGVLSVRSSAGVPQWVLLGRRFPAGYPWRPFLGGLFLAVYREFVIPPFGFHRTNLESHSC